MHAQTSQESTSNTRRRTNQSRCSPKTHQTRRNTHVGCVGTACAVSYANRRRYGAVPWGLKKGRSGDGESWSRVHILNLNTRATNDAGVKAHYKAALWPSVSSNANKKDRTANARARSTAPRDRLCSFIFINAVVSHDMAHPRQGGVKSNRRAGR